jgi:flagellar biosynthesis activator protein FlaF
MLSNQLEAYRSVQKNTLSGRELEASVLAKAALSLQECQQNWDDPNRDILLEKALKHNQIVWTFFQSELSKPDNPLPKKLRENIISLGLFVAKQIIYIMSYPSPDKLTIIININLSLAAGLRGSPE